MRTNSAKPFPERSHAITTDSREALFNTLYRQHSAELCAYLARLTGDAERGQELMHETFIRAYRAILNDTRWDNPRAWLYRVASRLAINEYRRKKLLAWVPLSGTEVAPGAGIEGDTLERVAVQTTLNRLPIKYRLPLLLYIYEEQSVAEIAAILDLSASAVKVRLYRAREMFHRIYTEESV